MLNNSDSTLVYETGSDDTFWNSKVTQVGERFHVSVYDADGDRRADREGSFTDQALAIAFADESVLRFASPPAKSSAGDQAAPELDAAFFANAILTRPGENLIETLRSERYEEE